MQPNTTLLAKKAISAALKADWDCAIELNQEILNKSPKDIDAKLRLGRAFIQTKQFSKAKTLFKEVLKADPINQVAYKNLELASQKRAQTIETNSVNARSLIKEPGTTTTTQLEITARGLTADSFTSCEELLIKTKKKSADIFKNGNGNKKLVGTITYEELIKKLNAASKMKARVSASFVKGQDKNIEILIKSSVPVFRSEKQDVRPYLKKGSITEPELEFEEN